MSDRFPGKAGHVDVSFEAEMMDLDACVSELEVKAKDRVLTREEGAQLHKTLRDVKLEFSVVRYCSGTHYENRYRALLLLMARIEALTPLLESDPQRAVLRHVDRMRIAYRQLFSMPENAAQNHSESVSVSR